MRSTEEILEENTSTIRIQREKNKVTRANKLNQRKNSEILSTRIVMFHDLMQDLITIQISHLSHEKCSNLIQKKMRKNIMLHKRIE